MGSNGTRHVHGSEIRSPEPLNISPMGRVRFSGKIELESPNVFQMVVWIGLDWFGDFSL